MQRVLWFVLGASATLAAVWLLPMHRVPEDQTMRAKEPVPAPAPNPPPEPEAAPRVLRPTSRATVIGPWLGENQVYRLLLKADGTYDWSGKPEASTREQGRSRLSPPPSTTPVGLEGLNDPHPWNAPGHGTWAWRDGALKLSAMGGIYFTWEAEEHALYGGFLGVPGGHTPGVTLFRMQYR